MKVKCINNLGFYTSVDLTVWKIYEVERQSDNLYYVKWDRWIIRTFYKTRFEEVEDLEEIWEDTEEVILSMNDYWNSVIETIKLELRLNDEEKQQIRDWIIDWKEFEFKITL